MSALGKAPLPTSVYFEDVGIRFSSMPENQFKCQCRHQIFGMAENHLNAVAEIGGKSAVFDAEDCHSGGTGQQGVVETMVWVTSAAPWNHGRKWLGEVLLHEPGQQQEHHNDVESEFVLLHF